MDKLKMRMAALGGKAKEMPFSKEAIGALQAKKQGDGMDKMLADLSGEGKEVPGEEPKMDAEVGELAPDEIQLILAYRKKKAAV